MMVAQEDRTKKKDEILAMEKMNDALQDKIRDNEQFKTCIVFLAGRGGGRFKQNLKSRDGIVSFLKSPEPITASSQTHKQTPPPSNLKKNV